MRHRNWIHTSDSEVGIQQSQYSTLLYSGRVRDKSKQANVLHAIIVELAALDDDRASVWYASVLGLH